MVRYLFYLALVGVIYYALTGLLRWKGGGRAARAPRDGVVEDVMVRDPECGVYLPRSLGLRRRLGGEERYFCSEECARAYAEKRA